MAERNVPGHTQLTRIPSRAYSTAATFASWITAAFVAQYGAECDQAVIPAIEAVSTMEPDPCGRMTATAARIPLTAQTVNRPVTETHLEQRESVVYRPRVTTELRDTPQTTPLVVTEYHWTPVYRRSWNVFAPPYLTYEWLPQTHVETRTDIVKTACTRSEYVPEKVTQQVPVTTQSYVPEKIVTHSYVGRAPNAAASVAVQNTAPADQSGVSIGGISKMDSDPPRGGTAWRPGVNTLQR